MAARRRNVQPKLREFDTWDFFDEATPAFTERVLLRSFYFVDEDRTQYVSVGFYPTRNYRPQVEFGAVKRNKTIFLVPADQHVKTLADILPWTFEAMCCNEPYEQKDGVFRLTATWDGPPGCIWITSTSA